MDAIFRIYEGLNRQGPGSKELTLRALDVIKYDLPDKPKLLDIGCGCGAQTLDLAENLSAEIIAIDIYQPYLDFLKFEASKKQLNSSVSTLNCSMSDLTFPDSSIDLLWSEGAIYITGMENGLRSWRRFLIPNGYIVFSEISWFKDNPPDPLLQYWKQNYPALKTIEQNLKSIRSIGYKVIDHFSLPTENWWDNYYNPLIQKIDALQKQSDLSEEMQKVINESDQEMDLFRKYSDWYGYEFYIVQVVD
jgi:ubiquinone/menaquinone biosynthesis C-methylase UbiE